MGANLVPFCFRKETIRNETRFMPDVRYDNIALPFVALVCDNMFEGKRERERERERETNDRIKKKTTTKLVPC